MIATTGTCVLFGLCAGPILSGQTLRSRLSSKLAEINVVDALTDDSKTALTALSDAFAKKSLPTDLDLSITGAPGISVMALIGLTAQRDGVPFLLAAGEPEPAACPP